MQQCMQKKRRHPKNEYRQERKYDICRKKKEFELQIQNAETIAISGHMNPDGDCIGSCLGLYTYIVEQYPEKQVTLLLEPVQEKFSFLKYADQITQKKKVQNRMTCFFLLIVPTQNVFMNLKNILKKQNTRFA